METFVTLAEGLIASDYALKNLNASLGKAQIKFTPAVKDLKNAYGGYKYVPLENIIDCSRPALTDNHLTVMQFPVSDLELKTVTLVTRVSHWDSGEWVQNSLAVPAELALGKDGALKFNQQTIGGGVTYARKIAYKPILGVADSDDDIDAGQEQPTIDARTKSQRTTPAQALAMGRHSEDVPPYTQPEKLPSKPADKAVTQTPEEWERRYKLWAEAFMECQTIDEWNRLIVPMMKERSDHPEYGRQFIIAAAEEAKRRAYVGDRTTGNYKASAKTPPMYAGGVKDEEATA